MTDSNLERHIHGLLAIPSVAQALAGPLRMVWEEIRRLCDEDPEVRRRVLGMWRELGGVERGGRRGVDSERRR